MLCFKWPKKEAGRCVIFENVRQNNNAENKAQILAPPSMSAVKKIFLGAVATGSLFWGANFSRKCKLRSGQPGFNSVDLVNVIRRCNIIGGPIYNGHFNGWQYELADLIEGYK